MEHGLLNMAWLRHTPTQAVVTCMRPARYRASPRSSMSGGGAHRGGVIGSLRLQKEAELSVFGDVDPSRLLMPQEQLN